MSASPVCPVSITIGTWAKVGSGSLRKVLAEKYGVTAIGQSTNTNTQHLNRLAELIDGGKIKVQLDKVFPLEQAREAFKHLEEGHPRGKVVVKIKD